MYYDAFINPEYAGSSDRPWMQAEYFDELGYDADDIAVFWEVYDTVA